MSGSGVPRVGVPGQSGWNTECRGGCIIGGLFCKFQKKFSFLVKKQHYYMQNLLYFDTMKIESTFFCIAQLDSVLYWKL